MNDDITYSFKKLEEASLRLAEGILQAENQLDYDGVIQRFEFTFELLWKTLRLFLASEGIITKSPKESFKEAFRYGLIKNDNIFFDILEDRNLTSHIYSEDMSLKVFSRIKNDYLKEIKEVVKELSEKIS